MRLIDADALLEQYDLKRATKYDNETVEQEEHSYSTLMLYEVASIIEDAPTVEAAPVVRGEWVYWKKQCEYCMNRSTCPYPENQESIESLKQWEIENKFWGSLKLICDYYVLDKNKYYLDNPPECNMKG